MLCIYYFRYLERSKIKCIGIIIEIRLDYCLKKYLRWECLVRNFEFFLYFDRWKFMYDMCLLLLVLIWWWYISKVEFKIKIWRVGYSIVVYFGWEIYVRYIRRYLYLIEK